MMADRASIERCVPHAGRMVLLDAVVRWDATRIACSAVPPTADHPLARDGAVPSVCAAEYAAQAAAVHGFLIDRPPAPRQGLLAKLTDVDLATAWIPRDRGSVLVKAELLSKTAAGCLYDFEVACDRTPIARGRLMVAFKQHTAQ
jgi:predicted hotdog family 3-hydroxylacyl-ACP dehydratase